MVERHIIKEYLLGGLSEGERQALEERLLLDRDFFERVMVVEEELVDGYVDGSLPEKEKFVTHLLSTPQQRQKLRIATALKNFSPKSEHKAESKAGVGGRKGPSWVRRVLAAMRVRRLPAGLKQNG